MMSAKMIMMMRRRRTMIMIKNYDDDECKDGYGPILSVTKIPLPPELVDSVEYVNQLPGTRLNLSEGR